MIKQRNKNLYVPSFNFLSLLGRIGLSLWKKKKKAAEISSLYLDWKRFLKKCKRTKNPNLSSSVGGFRIDTSFQHSIIN